MKKLIVLAVVFLGFTAPSFAQLTAIANISANIQSPTSITKNRDLNFGNVYTPSFSGGTVVVKAQETPNSEALGGMTLGAGSGQAAKFTIIGNSNDKPTLSLPNNTPISLFNGINYINVILSYSSNLTSQAPASGTSAQITLDGGGLAVFYVGGTVYFAPNQAWGSYTNVTDMEFIVNQ